MSESAVEFRKLPLRKVIWGAFSLSWQNRASLFSATSRPLLALIACSLASEVTRFSQSLTLCWLMYLLYGIATSWLAVTVHRLVLLETSDASEISAQAAKRIGLFLAFLVGVWLLYAALVLLIMSGVMNAFLMRYVPAGGERPELSVPMEWINSAARVLAFVVVARFSLVFPAIAIDQQPDLVAAWRASKRNAWRLAVVVGVLPWCLHQFAQIIYRDGASPAEFAMIVVLTTLFTVIEIVALSLSYWELTSPAPPPTDPPA
jgi:hypothetical protein